jgi:hypothetical protein
VAVVSEESVKEPPDDSRSKRRRQLFLPFMDGVVLREPVEEAPADVSALTQWMYERFGYPMQVVLTENRRTLFSFRVRRNGGVLRLHRIFMEASKDVWEALASFIEGNREEARETLRAFAKANQEEFGREDRNQRKESLRQHGRIFHLGEMFRSLNERYFHGELNVDISWGQWGRRPKRCVRLGSFDLDRGLIRIHPVLDDPSVPRRVLEGVVYHEMLHALLGAENTTGRKSLHGPSFREKEKAFPDWEANDAWIRTHIPKLLSRRR